MRLGPQQQGVPTTAGCCADGLDVIRPSVQPVGLYDRNAAMSGKRFTRDTSGQLVKMPGWFSWRHETREAHDDAVLRYLTAHPRAARRKHAAQRLRQLTKSP